MSTDETSQSRSFLEHTQSKQEREDFWDRNEDVRETIRLCARALQRGERRHFYFIATKLQQTLVPRLLDGGDKRPEDYDGCVGDHREWAFKALTQFIERPDVFTAAVSDDDSDRIAGNATLTNVGHGFEAGHRRCVPLVHRDR